MERELPDCILWFIFSKLSLKDQFKTCTLSKHWLREWRLSSTHLNFDLYSTLPTDFPLFPSLQSQFTARVDQFMLNYQQATISSIRVKFPLSDDDDSDVIGRLISQGIAKGVKHIQLLFSNETNHTDFNSESKPYRFSLSLLSKAESLTYLHLEKCLLVVPIPMVFSGLKNLTTLVLQLILVSQDLLDSLFSNCIHLLDFTLDNCDLSYFFKIISPTLSRLKFVNRPESIAMLNIIAPNLSSLEYSCDGGNIINLAAHKLSRFICRIRIRSLMIGFVHMSTLNFLTTITLDGFDQFWFMQYLFEECIQLEDVAFKNCSMPHDMEITSTKLIHLKIINCGFDSYDKISINAENLSSFEYSGVAGQFSVRAPKLSKVFWNAAVRKKNQNSLGPIPELHQIENLAIITSLSQISKLKVLGRFQNLRQLELFIDEGYYPSRESFSILDILMASQHLQKLSVTVSYSTLFVKQAYWLERSIQRNSAKFYHNELKYVELHGCVSTPLAIEFARNLLRNVTSLKKITFNSLDKFYLGAETWTKGSDSCWIFNRNFIYESLRDEVKGQCELIIL